MTRMSEAADGARRGDSSATGDDVTRRSYQTERRRHRLAPSARSPALRSPPALRLVGKRAVGGGEGVGHVAWIAGGRDDGGDGGMGEDPLQEEPGPARCMSRAYTCRSIVSAQVDDGRARRNSSA